MLKGKNAEENIFLIKIFSGCSGESRTIVISKLVERYPYLKIDYQF